MPKWLTTKQVSRDLNITTDSLRQWLREGRVPGAAKLPTGRYRLPHDTVKTLLRSSSCASDAEVTAGV